MRIALVYVAIVACILLLHRLWTKTRNRKGPEPPLLASKIPWIGHAIGMIRFKKDYYKHLRDRCSLPIITLPLPLGKIYVVFSVPTIQAVQKQHKTLAFQPIQAKFSVKLCGASKEAYRILQRDMDIENGEYGNIYLSMHQALNPGPTLDELNRVMIDGVCESIDRMCPPPGTSKRISLVSWLRHNVTLATTDSVYGPHNPFRDPKIETAFWEFERQIPKLIFLPNFLARTGATARQTVATAFSNFFTSNHHHLASGLVQDFYASEISYGFSLSDRSLFEVGHALAILGNTSGAVFWLIFYIFSNPLVLAEIRGEVEKIIVTGTDEKTGEGVNVVDMTKISTLCPVLVSTFREAIRLHSIGISLRQVCKDTVVNDTYHLEKGNMILMPTVAIHSDTRIWGDDAREFNHRRFVTGEADGKANGKKKVSPAAFRSFGGGTTLCPGRHFATTQTMVWAVMLVMRFDMEPVSVAGEARTTSSNAANYTESGEKTGAKWIQPPTENTNLANVMAAPDHDIEVEITERDVYRGLGWRVRTTDSEAMFGVTVEDLGEDGEGEHGGKV